MVLLSISIRDTRTVAVLGGGLYATVVLSWLFSAGVYLSSGSNLVAVVDFGYALVGMFLTAAVPLYLFGRLSLVSAPLATLWVLGETVYQWLYGAHLHPLSSYLTVWPILLGFVLTITLVEAVLRLGLDRTIGRFGLRRIF
jgi:hypothetical protein